MMELKNLDAILQEDNYFLLLGIDENSDEEKLRQAYRSLAKQFHPDRFSDSAEKKQAEKAFARISQAFTTLKNPLDRQQYATKLRLIQDNGRLAEEERQKKAEECFQKGLQCEKSGNFDRAINHYQEAIQFSNRMARYHSRLGFALMRKGWNGYAQAEFKIALTFDPADMLALKHYRPTNQSKQEKASLAEQFKNIFAKTKSLRLGDILIEQGWLTGDQLKEALRKQREDKLLLGEILIRMHYLKPEQLAQALIHQSEAIS